MKPEFIKKNGKILPNTALEALWSMDATDYCEEKCPLGGPDTANARCDCYWRGGDQTRADCMKALDKIREKGVNNIGQQHKNIVAGMVAFWSHDYESLKGASKIVLQPNGEGEL
jgi:hypothetical protein